MSVTPNKLQAKAAPIFERFFLLELDIIRMLADALGIGIGKSDWAAKRRKERDRTKTAAKKRIDATLSAARVLFLQLVAESYAGGMTEFLVEFEIVLEDGRPPTDSRRIMDILQRMDKDMNKMRGRVLRRTDDIYSRIVAQAQNQANTDKLLGTQAVQNAIDRFVEAGISGFTDKLGRRWGIAEYSEMAVKTALARARLAGYIDMALERGYDLAIVSDHDDECEKCALWENKVISLTGLMAGHPDCEGTLEQAMDDGLFHPNCWHWLTVWIPGVSKKPPKKKRTKEQNRDGYNNRQQMRLYERNVRRWKKLQQSALTPEREREAKAHVDKWQRRIRELNEREGTPIARGRTGVKVPLSDEAKKLKVLPNGGIIDAGLAKRYLDLEKKANDLGFISADFTGLDPKAVRGTLKAMEKVMEQYPELQGTVSNIGIGDKGIMACVPNNKTLDTYNITMNPEYFTDVDVLKAYYAEAVKRGEFTRGTDWRNVGVHELGHVLNGLAIQKTQQPSLYVKDWNIGITASDIITEAWNEVSSQYSAGTNLHDARKLLSNYASESEAETIAEAFSDVFSNRKKAQALSRGIVGVLKRLLR